MMQLGSVKKSVISKSYSGIIKALSCFYFLCSLFLLSPSEGNSQVIKDVKVQGEIYYSVLTVVPSTHFSNGFSEVFIKVTSPNHPMKVSVWSVDAREVIVSTSINSNSSGTLIFKSVFEQNYGVQTYSNTNKYYVIYHPQSENNFDIDFNLTIQSYSEYHGFWLYMFDEEGVLDNKPVNTYMVFTSTDCIGKTMSTCYHESSWLGSENSIHDSVLIGFSSGMNIRAIDFDSGVGFASKLSSSSSSFLGGFYNYYYLGVGSAEDILSEKIVRLYANDLNKDDDGDGLSRDLELLINTCDNVNTHSFCSNVYNMTDSDRDGIEDNFELLGVENQIYSQFDVLEYAETLWFHHWGANPDHKDVFIELDYDSDHFSENPFISMSPAGMLLWFDERQKPFLEGSDLELDNPSGLFGINMHIDIGTDAPLSIADKMGNWGGGGDGVADASEPDADLYNVLRVENMSSFRFNYFRWGVMSADGGGKAPATAFRATFDNARTFSHELGHTMGLSHSPLLRPDESEDGIDFRTCNPFYRSIMNYGDSSSISFSHGSLNNFNLNSTYANENDNFNGVLIDSFFDGVDAVYDTGNNTYVDWSLDYSVENDIIRTPVNMTDRGSCSIYTHEVFGYRIFEYDVATSALYITKPQMIVFNEYIYIFYMDEDGSLNYMNSKIETLGDSSCIHGNGYYSDPKCFNWSENSVVESLGKDIEDISIEEYKGILYIAVVKGDDLSIYEFDIGSTYPELEDFDSEIYMGKSYTRVDMSRGILNFDMCVYFGGEKIDNTENKIYMYSCKDLSGSWIAPEVVLDENGNNIEGPYGPSVEHWPNLNPTPSSYVGKETLCSAFTVDGGEIKTYCLDNNINKWVANEDMLPRPEWTRGDVNLSYTYYRKPGGELLEDKPGRFMISYNGANADEASWTVATGKLDSNNDPFSLSPALNKMNTRDAWAFADRNTAPIIYDHENLGGAKAAWVRRDSFDEDKSYLSFYRTGDGVIDGKFIDANDYYIMEAHLCRELRGQNFCGDYTSTRNGY